MKHTGFIRLLLRSLLVAGVFIAFSHQQAQALTVSPVRLELTADPGTNISSDFTLYNEEQVVKTFYVSSENFEAQGESGTPNFIPSKTGLATWITAPTEITLQPGERKTIPFSIQVPASAEPGGNFAALFFGTTPPQKQGDVQVAIGGKIGILVLLKVNGAINEKGGVLEFFAGNRQSFFTQVPIQFFYRFQNSGADRVKPNGTLVIKNMVGRTVTEMKANPTEGNVLPQSIRKFELSWGDTYDGGNFFTTAGWQWKHWHVGRYTAQLHLTYGQEDQEVVDTSLALWIIPWQLLSIMLVVLVIVGVILKYLISAYNSWIISRARGGKRRK